MIIFQNPTDKLIYVSICLNVFHIKYHPENLRLYQIHAALIIGKARDLNQFVTLLNHNKINYQNMLVFKDTLITTVQRLSIHPPSCCEQCGACLQFQIVRSISSSVVQRIHVGYVQYSKHQDVHFQMFHLTEQKRMLMIM